MRVEVFLTLRVDTRSAPHEDQRPVTLVKTFEVPAIFDEMLLQDDEMPEGLVMVITLAGVKFRTGTGDFSAWADVALAACHYDAYLDSLLISQWQRSLT